ncbi:unnamed protein product [Anisakis simplex]|uniref:3-hydroxyisobutyryl-CoA hydrolase n=1 Tax=Anisakis simplex TaxID=6269 RepID=A0A0M3JL21_ANISI|nr:unnamed protein product [Anisakis simplex]
MHLHASTGNEVIISALSAKRIVTLNRPRALNALNLSMVRSMYPSFKFGSDGFQCIRLIKRPVRKVVQRCPSG